MSITALQAQEFYETEVQPTLELLDGPISAFVFSAEYDAKLKAQAIEEAVIPSGAFSECDVFDDSLESKNTAVSRREAKMGQEILKILSAESDEMGDTLNLLHTEQEVYRTVIVETARVIKNEQIAGRLTPRNRAIYERALTEAQENLFSSPDKATDDLVIGLFNQDIEKATNNLSIPQLNYVDEFVAKYPWIKADSKQPGMETPGQENLESLSAYLHEQYDKVFQGIKEDYKDISNATLVQMTNEFMKRIGLPMADGETDKQGWLCIESDEIKGFQVVPSKMRLLSGRRSFEITWKVYEGLMVHEVLGHVLRAENGRLSGYGALQTGLPRVNDAEEGVGLTLQKLWSGDVKESLGRDHFRYLAVSYAQGSLDGKGHNETETLHFTSGFMTAVQLAKKGPSADVGETERKQRALAYDHVKRAFRGMPEGSVLWSNTSYLKGRLDIMRFIKGSKQNPKDLLSYLQQGKFDPNNQEHVKLMDYVVRKHKN